MSGDTRIAVCHACGVQNNIAHGSQLSKARCGRCKAGLATPEPVDISLEIFDRLVKFDQGRWVVDAWAPWCGPCQAMAPAYINAAQQAVDATRFFKINCDVYPDIAKRLNVRGIPTLAAYANGARRDVQAGAMTQNQLEHWLSQALS